ncbi:hypothetical protein BJX96DRAFT_151350 [Aspergillus floccosus]
MPQKIASSSRELEFKSFQDWNGDRPSQTLIFHDGSSSWWIKVEIAWSLPESLLGLGYFKRRSTLQEFIKAIDFSQLDLVDDTVTRINLTLAEQSHKPIPIRFVRMTIRKRQTCFYLLPIECPSRLTKTRGGLYTRFWTKLKIYLPLRLVI